MVVVHGERPPPAAFNPYSISLSIPTPAILCMVNVDSRGIELVDGTAHPFTPWTRGAYVRESPLRVAPPAPALQAPVLTGAAGGQGTPIGPVAQATDGGAQTAGR